MRTEPHEPRWELVASQDRVEVVDAAAIAFVEDFQRRLEDDRRRRRAADEARTEAARSDATRRNRRKRDRRARR